MINVFSRTSEREFMTQCNKNQLWIVNQTTYIHTGIQMEMSVYDNELEWAVLKQMPNGYCAYYARTNFVICAHRDEKESVPYRATWSFLYVICTYISTQFFLSLICTLCHTTGRGFFLQNTSTEAINTIQMLNDMNYFSMYFFFHPGARKNNNNKVKLNFPCIFRTSIVLTSDFFFALLCTRNREKCF